jgi:DNA-binding response OmpR family regulator
MKKVLIVDDEPHVARVLELTLRPRGYQVLSLSDPRVAMETLRSYAPDVLITDIQMPGLSGRELCELIRAEMPQRTFMVMVMTSMAASDSREWVNRMPDIVFVEKPLSPRSVAARLDAHFAQTAASGA